MPFYDFGDADDHYHIQPKPEEEGERLDRFLGLYCKVLSRSRLKALIETGCVLENGRIVSTPSLKVKGSAFYDLYVPPPENLVLEAENIPLDVLYEDKSLIVLNKQAGMNVHPGAGHRTGTLVHALLHHCQGTLSGIGGVERPGIVHRLDKDTSGVLVAAKTDEAHQGLARQFADHSVERLYRAFTQRAPKPEEGKISAPLGRSPYNRKKMAIRPEGGKRAITYYKTLKHYGISSQGPAGGAEAALLACRLETGRTHQIRVHMAHKGVPLIGDPLYGRQTSPPKNDRRDFFPPAERGGKKNKPVSLLSHMSLEKGKGRALPYFHRQALHASVLGFKHPVTGKILRFETNFPEDMLKLEVLLEHL